MNFLLALGSLLCWALFGVLVKTEFAVITSVAAMVITTGVYVWHVTKTGNI